MHFDLTDQYHDRPSAFHHLDPRVKVVVVFVYLLGLSLTTDGSWLAFLTFFGILLIAVRGSQLELTFTIRRSFIALPFMLAALPIIFLAEGPVLGTLPVVGWSVSAAGLERFLTIMFRTWLGVQAGILLTVTTRFPDLIWAIGALHVPPVMVAIITFMYRYIFLVVDQAARMLQARRARSSRRKGFKPPGVVWQGRVAGMMVGNLFLRSLERSERVYDAMASRGYDGVPRTLRRYQMNSTDWLMLMVALLIITLLVAWANLGL